MEVNLELVRTILSGITLVSLLIAYLSYRSNIKKQELDKQLSRDKEILEQSILSLKWAYDTLTDQGSSIPPVADRLKWLTTARHLCRYKELSNSIVSDVYKCVLSENEEYWRHMFYIALDHHALKRKEYYMDQNVHDWRENIEPKSAKVINEFSTWKEGTVDPLDEYDESDLVSSSKGTIGRGIESYCNEFEVIKARLEEEHNQSRKQDASDAGASA